MVVMMAAVRTREETARTQQEAAARRLTELVAEDGRLEEQSVQRAERIAELEAKALQFPDAQKIQGNVLEQVEEAWGARHQALTLSFQGMAGSMLRIGGKMSGMRS